MPITIHNISSNSYYSSEHSANKRELSRKVGPNTNTNNHGQREISSEKCPSKILRKLNIVSLYKVQEATNNPRDFCYIQSILVPAKFNWHYLSSMSTLWDHESQSHLKANYVIRKWAKWKEI